MKKTNKDKKRSFGASFTKKGAKQKLLCMGCGEHFVHIPDLHTDECPYCMCVHCLHIETLKHLNFKTLKNIIVDKHRWWSGFELVPEQSADVVVDKMRAYLKEYYGQNNLLEKKVKQKQEVKE